VLRANDIAITQAPVSFGDSGHVSVFERHLDRDDRAIRLSARRWASTPPVAGDAPLRPDPGLDRLVEVIDSALGILRQNRSANPDHQPDGPALWLVVPPG